MIFFFCLFSIRRLYKGKIAVKPKISADQNKSYFLRNPYFQEVEEK